MPNSIIHSNNAIVMSLLKDDSSFIKELFSRLRSPTISIKSKKNLLLFVCMANVVEMIPNPLLDRMEVISIAGYITDEKMHIARDYLEKATREACGIKPEQVEVTDSALLALIENYCRQVGVCNLQKQIEKIYRKIALQIVRKGAGSGSGSTETVTKGGAESTIESEKETGNAVEAEIVEPTSDQIATSIDQSGTPEVYSELKQILPIFSF